MVAELALPAPSSERTAKVYVASGSELRSYVRGLEQEENGDTTVAPRVSRHSKVEVAFPLKAQVGLGSELVGGGVEVMLGEVSGAVSKV